MFAQILPARIDNTYRGFKPALWVLGMLLTLKGVIGLRSIFDGHAVATAADGIPVDTFTPAGAQTVVALFASLGLAQLVLCALGVLALVRYRAAVPFMFMLLLLEHLSRRLIGQFLPVPRTGTPPGSIVNLVLLALMVVGLALSLWDRQGHRPQD